MQDMLRLVQPLIPSFRRYARAMLRDGEAADDLVQDTLERAISRWHQRRADGEVRTWMFTILHRLAINRLKQRTRRGSHVSADGLDEAQLVQPAPQESGLHQADILDAIARLPDDQRAVLLLVSVEELSYAEAAAALDIPVGTIMSRLSRARERLRWDLSAERPKGRPHLRRVK